LYSFHVFLSCNFSYDDGVDAGSVQSTRTSRRTVERGPDNGESLRAYNSGLNATSLSR
jgi:hypothetical protein